MSEPITFILAERSPGGAQSLVVRMCEALARLDRRIRLVDYRNGYVAANLAPEARAHVELIDIECGSGAAGILEACEPGTVVAFDRQALAFAAVGSSARPKLLIWSIFPPYWGQGPGPTERKTATVDRLLGLVLRQQILRRALRYGGIVTIDEEGADLIRRAAGLGHPAPQIVPIPINEDAVGFRSPSCAGRIRACYVGRAQVWKVTPFAKLLADFGTVPGVEISVVSDDPDKFMELTRGLGEPAFRVTALGPLSLAELRSYLQRDVDLAFAMGTAALEAASLGIPTVVMDYSATRFPNQYRYRWLHEMPGRALGFKVEDLHALDGKGHLEIVDELTRNAPRVASLCRQAVVEKFAVDRVVRDFIDAVDRNELTLDMLRELPLSWLYGVWRRLGAPRPLSVRSQLN